MAAASRRRLRFARLRGPPYVPSASRLHSMGNVHSEIAVRECDRASTFSSIASNGNVSIRMRILPR